MVVAVEGYGGLAEPGLRGTEADLRGIGSGWEREGKEEMAMGREGMDEGGIFEGFGMNEEGRRALGRGEASGLPSTVSWNCTSTSVSTPHVFISFPRRGARHGVWLDQTTCLVRFCFRFTSSTGPLDVVISFDLSLPVPRLAACPAFRA